MANITKGISDVDSIGSTEPRYWVTPTGLLSKRAATIGTHTMFDMIQAIHGFQAFMWESTEFGKTSENHFQS